MIHEDVSGTSSLPEDEWGTTEFTPLGVDDLRRTVPRFQQVFDLVRAKPDARVNQLRFLADAIVKDPGLVAQIHDNLELIGQLRPEEVDTIEEVRTAIPQAVEAAVANRTRLDDFTPERIEQIVQIYVDTQRPAREYVEAILSGLFNSPQTVEQAVDLHYNAAMAMASTLDRDVREELYSILCFEKEWHSPESRGVYLFFLGCIFADTDEHLSKFYSIREGLTLVGRLIEMVGGQFPFFPKRVTEAFIGLYETYRTLQQHQGGFPLELKAPTSSEIARAKAVLDYLGRRTNIRKEILERITGSSDERTAMFIDDGDSIEIKIESYKAVREAYASLGWPGNVIEVPDTFLSLAIKQKFNPQLTAALWEDAVGSLLIEGYRRLTSRPIELTDTLRLDIIGKEVVSSEERQRIINGVQETLLIGESQNPLLQPRPDLVGACEAAEIRGGVICTFDVGNRVKFALIAGVDGNRVGRLASTLDTHRPLILSEGRRGIEDKVSNFREEIKASFTRSVEKRGYEVLADPALRQYGYWSLTFRESGSDGISVEVKIGSGRNHLVAYEFFLDRLLRIVPGGDVLQFLSQQDQVWLELLTLSHLKRVMCMTTREEEVADELMGGRIQYEKGYKRQVISRGDHLREQGSRRGFTQRAFELYLKSRFYRMFGKDLATLNRERGKDFGIGMITYVSASEYEAEANLPPVRIAFKGIREDIETVIDLGKLSDEEIERITAEILGEIAGD